MGLELPQARIVCGRIGRTMQNGRCDWSWWLHKPQPIRIPSLNGFEITGQFGVSEEQFLIFKNFFFFLRVHHKFTDTHADPYNAKRKWKFLFFLSASYSLSLFVFYSF